MQNLWYRGITFNGRASEFIGRTFICCAVFSISCNGEHTLPAVFCGVMCDIAMNCVVNSASSKDWRFTSWMMGM